MSQPPTCAPPDPRPRRPRHPIPAGACDCHFHVFDGPSPQVAARSYTAPAAPLAAYRSMAETLGLTRAVIVQPSIYGTDNRTTLEHLAHRSMRAVVVVDDETPARDLRDLSAQGVVGARVNMLFSSGARSGNLATLGRTLADLGWHLQILADVSTLPDLAATLGNLPIPIVFDHMGHLPARKGVNDPGFQTLLRLLETGDTWVKLSAAYRLTDPDRPGYSDVLPLAKAIVAANPDRLVWGSDWPHPAFQGAMPNDGNLLDLLFDWADAETASAILTRNPERLYGFPRWNDEDV